LQELECTKDARGLGKIPAGHGKILHNSAAQEHPKVLPRTAEAGAHSPENGAAPISPTRPGSRGAEKTREPDRKRTRPRRGNTLLASQVHDVPTQVR